MNPAPLDLRDHLSIVKARKWIVLAIVGTTTIVALFYSYRQTPVYTSSAEVVVRPATFDPNPTSFGVLNMSTEVQLASSRTVARLADGRLAESGLQPGSLSVEQVEDTETLMFTSVSPDPAAARATANAYANAYLQLRRAQVLTQLQAARQPYLDQIDQIRKQRQNILELLPTVQDETEKALLTARYTSLLSLRAAIVGKLNDLVSPENLLIGSVVRSAQLPGSPSGLSHAALGVIGLAVGLALGIAVVFLADRLDDRVRGPEELELSSGAPVLGYIPRRTPETGPPVTLSDPTSEAAEAYKALRVMLLHAAGQRDLKSVIITSSLASEGKTATTANLAVAIALAGKKVVVVSADLRRPALWSYFPTRQEKGLIDVLVGKRKPMDALSRISGIRDLWVLHAGQAVASPGPLELLGSESMSDLMSELRDFADFVLIDTPPLLVSRDVSAMAGLADGILFVVDPQLAQRATIQQALHELQLAGTSIIGVVVNKYDPRRFRAYGAGYRYQYSYDGRKQGADQVLQSPPPRSLIPSQAVSSPTEESENETR
jgi:capsular exopolysaccharide synthesis family protein